MAICRPSSLTLPRVPPRRCPRRPGSFRSPIRPRSPINLCRAPSSREVLETKIEDIDNRLNRLEPMLFERLVTTMETNNALYSQKLLAVRSEIDALRLLKAHDLASMQSRVDGETSTITHLCDEKFRSLDAQTSKAVIDVRIATDAAFAAASAAAQSQESAFTKQIDQLASNVQLISKASDDKLTDLKDRIVAMESRSSVMDPTTVAALRDQAQTIAVLKQSNDQGSGTYRQRISTSFMLTH